MRLKIFLWFIRLFIDSREEYTILIKNLFNGYVNLMNEEEKKTHIRRIASTKGLLEVFANYEHQRGKI